MPGKPLYRIVMIGILPVLLHAAAFAASMPSQNSANSIVCSSHENPRLNKNLLIIHSLSKQNSDLKPLIGQLEQAIFLPKECLQNVIIIITKELWNEYFNQNHPPLSSGPLNNALYTLDKTDAVIIMPGLAIDPTMQLASEVSEDHFAGIAVSRLTKVSDIAAKELLAPNSQDKPLNHEALRKILITKSELCSSRLPYWNICLNGHGFPKIIAEYSLQEFEEILNLFDRELFVKEFWYFSCYSGALSNREHFFGTKTFAYPIMSIGTDSSSIWSNPLTFMNAFNLSKSQNKALTTLCEQKHYLPPILSLEPYKKPFRSGRFSIIPPNGGYPNLDNLPFIREKDSTKFTLLNTNYVLEITDQLLNNCRIYNNNKLDISDDIALVFLLSHDLHDITLSIHGQQPPAFLFPDQAPCITRIGLIDFVDIKNTADVWDLLLQKMFGNESKHDLHEHIFLVNAIQFAGSCIPQYKSVFVGIQEKFVKTERQILSENGIAFHDSMAKRAVWFDQSSGILHEHVRIFPFGTEQLKKDDLIRIIGPTYIGLGCVFGLVLLAIAIGANNYKILSTYSVIALSSIFSIISYLKRCKNSSPYPSKWHMNAFDKWLSEKNKLGEEKSGNSSSNLCTLLAKRSFNSVYTDKAVITPEKHESYRRWFNSFYENLDIKKLIEIPDSCLYLPKRVE